MIRVNGNLLEIYLCVSSVSTSPLSDVVFCFLIVANKHRYSIEDIIIIIVMVEIKVL